MNKVITAIIAVLIVIGVVLVVNKGKKVEAPVETSPNVEVNATSTSMGTTTPNTTATSTITLKTYTLADLALHTDSKSCWATISGKVYDLTKWIPQHPGGPEKILSICGKDGTSKFMGQHGSNAQIVAGLQNFYIGDLK